MAEETPENQPKHAERVRRSRPKKPSLKLSPDSGLDFPKNLADLVDWYTHEVEDITRAAQLRIKDATEFVSACADRKISMEETAERWDAYGNKWGSDTFPCGISQSRYMTDEEINNAIKKEREESRKR